MLVLFAPSLAILERDLPSAIARLATAGGLWVAWPKRSSGVPTDLDENRIRGIGLAAGLVDNKVCAIDDTWSGLRFVFRQKDRPPKVRLLQSVVSPSIKREPPDLGTVVMG